MISKLIRSDVTNPFPHIMGLIRKITNDINDNKHKNYLKQIFLRVFVFGFAVSSVILIERDTPSFLHSRVLSHIL